VSTVSLDRDDIAAAEENCEYGLVKPGRDSWSGGYGVAAAAEDCEHRLVKPGRRYERGGRNLGKSAPTVNGTISTDCKRDGI